MNLKQKLKNFMTSFLLMFQRVGNVIQGIYNRFKPLFNVLGVFVLFVIFNQVWDVYEDYEAFRHFERQGNIVFFRDDTLYRFEFEDLDLIEDNPYCNCLLNEIVTSNKPATQADTSTIGQIEHVQPTQKKTIGQNTYPLK